MAVTETTQVEHYRGLLLNTTPKGSKGFYIQHLQSIHSLMLTARLRMTRPLVSHLVIDEPKYPSHEPNEPTVNALKRLSEELDRWYAERSGRTKEEIAKSRPVSYFACLETRPRNKQEHLHVMVIFDSLPSNSTSLALLAERLSKLSKKNACKIYHRRSEARSLNVDQETGEIRTNSSGGLSRLGSTQYHNLITEIQDAFERYSYLAKVQTKDQDQIKGLNYSHSRIIKNKPAPEHNTEETNASNTRIIDLPEQEALLSVRDIYKDCTNKERSARAITVRSCQSHRVHKRASRHSKLFHGQENYHSFTKGSQNSKNYDISIRI